MTLTLTLTLALALALALPAPGRPLTTQVRRQLTSDCDFDGCGCGCPESRHGAGSQRNRDGGCGGPESRYGAGSQRSRNGDRGGAGSRRMCYGSCCRHVRAGRCRVSHGVGQRKYVRRSGACRRGRCGGSGAKPWPLIHSPWPLLGARLQTGAKTARR